MNRLLAPLALLAIPALAFAQPLNPNLMKYACGPANRMFSTLSATSVYSATSAGFDLNTLPTFTGKSCTGDKPFFFSVPVAEGSYRVTVVLGGDKPATTTVWSEARRLSLEKIATAANESKTETFDVNVRVPEIGGDPAHHVHLKPREVGNLDWDRKLTLEFNGDRPSVRSITIEPITPHEPTIYLAGDSTVVDQDIEPWAAWGQMLPRFFRPGVVVANHAESGETIKSFVGEQRFAKIFSLIQPGDYLFMQFNHNDQKINPRTHQPVVTLDEYRALLTEYIAKARAAGATPVLVTSMNRRTFDASGDITNSLGDYPDTMREVAAQEHVALIDVNAMSKTLFETMGPEGTLRAFMHYPANAFPNQTEAISDDTHFNKYGAYELARCITHGIREANLPLKKSLVNDVPDFNPAHPDDVNTFHLPATPIPPKTTDVTKLPQT
ncbi:rhamnogalacturonan acetylesterase [Edaphobacter sp.]|uniref:rhamnogalacturonan acetylesterase n=1 Tax=Edaphobacter sp. TaxID=1934404 RepID=UPI002DBCC814|nr:rhamnogalacturonan acetylesterase [Edaphobacter sp.]HEU5340392.1 rhamnogalacturonan acetylesterase [Edaphobacter sp.]